MFEEVPRTRRGLARLTARHVVLGPFVIGGGVLLAAIGGSVAVATTVLTATSIRANDVPPHAVQHPVVVASPGRTAPAHQPPAAGSDDRTAGPTHSRSVAGAPASQPLVPGSPSASPTAVPGQPGTEPSGSGRPTADPSASTSGPVGNALIYVIGYADQRLQFEYAVVSPGAGPNGSDLYQVDSPRHYSATLATDLTVTSGGQLCPPAGSRCSLDQLTEAAGAGFYAIAAIDPADQLHSILEVDNAGASSGFAPQSTATGTPSPSPTRS
jgi:hypothetical protein